MHQKIKMFYRGTTLIEALVLLAIFAIVGVAFSQVWAVGTQLIFETRNRLGATSIAAEKMEIIRNLAYSAIGTKTPNGGGGWNYGIPAGDILQDETVNSNNHSYQVHTFVEYIDDPFDGVVSGSPADVVPSDYKKVFVTVSWGSGSETQRVEESSVFVPQGVEQSAGGGVLSINALDTSGIAIPSATIHITNTQTSPHIDVTATADSTGNLTLPAAPASLQSYVISVSKSGYFPVTTYPTISNGGAFTPTEAHASVIAGSLSQTTLVTDQVVNLTLKTQDPFGVDIPNVSMQLTGGKQIGTGPTTYSYNQTISSGSGASFLLSNESPGTYTVVPSLATHVFLRTDPVELVLGEIVMSPGQTKQTTLIFADKSIGSLLATVQKESDGTPISGATVHLTNTLLSYDATVTTDSLGRAYFPTSAPALSSGSYTIDISATGFDPKNDTVSVSGSLVQQTFLLSVD